MKTGTLGAAVVTGYVLGRFHKMKWALAIAAIAGGKRLAGKQGNPLGQASELAKSVGLEQLTGDLRGRLVEAGKAAAVSAVSSKIDSVSEGLRSRSDSLRGDGQGGREAGDDEPADAADGADGEEPEERDRERPAGRGRPGGRRPASGNGGDRRPRRRAQDGDREPARRRSADTAGGRRAAGSRRGGDQ
jgi:hypothetical protein